MFGRSECFLVILYLAQVRYGRTGEIYLAQVRYGTAGETMIFILTVIWRSIFEETGSQTFVLNLMLRTKSPCIHGNADKKKFNVKKNNNKNYRSVNSRAASLRTWSEIVIASSLWDPQWRRID